MPYSGVISLNKALTSDYVYITRALMGQTTTVTFSNLLSVEKDKLTRNKPDAEKVVTELYVKLRPAL